MIEHSDTAAALRRHPERFRGPVADTYDVIVVGSGPGGLVAAALYARTAKRVLVLDGHYVAGGNATVFRRKRWEFDVGIHYVGDCGPGGVIPRILAGCGVTGVRFRPMDAELEQLSFPDLDFTIPRDKATFMARLLERFPTEARGIRRYFRLLDQVSTMQANLGAARWKQLLMVFRSPLVLRWANTNLGAFLDSCTRDPTLRAILTAQNGTYAIAPSRVSTVLHAGLQDHYFVNGGWYPEGGGQVIADHLAAAIEAAGGDIRLRARVTRIHVEDGRVTGVTFENKHLGTRTVRAPLVVSNADLKRTVLELVGPEHFPADYVERVRGFEMALPLFVVFLGLDVPASALPWGNANRWIFGSCDFDHEYAMITRGEMPERPFVYIATASAKDPENPRLAPPGHTNMQVMTIVPATPTFWGITRAQAEDGTYEASEGYAYRKARVVDLVLDQAERAFPDLRRHIVYQEAATPLTHTRYTRSTGGTSYGIAATPAQFLRNRPGAATPIAGLLLAGASTRSGHGIAGAMLSGVYAADRGLRDGTATRVLHG
jgi:all-trans-retinol 13,14-reductase